MFTHRLKILASMLIAIILVEGYTYFSQNPGIIPAQADNIKGLLANIKFPTYNIKKLFTLNFSSPNNGTIKQLDNQNDPVNFTQVSTTPYPLQPTTYFQPTRPVQPIKPTLPAVVLTKAGPTPDDELVDFPFEPGDIDNLPGNVPTKPPKPTKAPKPTKTPTPPPITTDLRPGTSLVEIFKEVNKRACFPTALLWAFKTEETGPRFKNDSSSTIKIYNTYGWWITGAGNPCDGYGYYEQTGIVPSDSVNAGSSCLSNPVGNPNDIKIMGLFQISEQEQGVAQKYISSTIPKNDRRVLFDNSLMFAYITKSRVPGSPPSDCNSWPDDVIKMVAEKHHGVCVYDYGNGTKGDYCKEVLDLYKQYK